jgi:hypothetical protein
MRINPRWAGLLAGLLFACIAALGAVEIGMERILVLHELGRPVSSVARGNTEVLTYAKGVRITLKDGRVSEIVGLKPTASSGRATVVEPPAEPTTEPALTKAETDELDKMEKAQAEASAKARAEMEKAIGDIENMHDHPPAHEAPAFKLKEFALGLALKWLLTLAALKLTCKYWGVEVFWTGLMTVALVDVLVRGAVGLVGLLLLQMPSLFYADEAVAAFVMVGVLRKVSINQSLAQAVQITMTAKTFSIVVGSLVVTVLLRLLN